MAYCGSGYRNLVYDVEHLNRASQAEAERAKLGCKTDFVDCKDKGGYKKSDPCNQTCLFGEKEEDPLKICN